MKPDLYTKAVLTIIALMLAVIACKPLINPETTASAQGMFAGVQIGAHTGGFLLFDTKTGDIWEYSYSYERGGAGPLHWDVRHYGKISTLGQPPSGGNLPRGNP